MFNPIGVHLIADFYGCKNQLYLTNVDVLRKLLLDAADEAEVTIISDHFRKFDKGGGISGVLIIAESHLSVHTWPEYCYLAFDFFTCGDKAKPWEALFYVKKKIDASFYEVQEIKRGDRRYKPNKLTGVLD